MRKDEISVGDYAHIYNRGNRKMVIFNGNEDYWRLMNILRYFNNQKSTEKVFQELFFLKKSGRCNDFEWPPSWSERKPLVEVKTFCLMPNHFHLLLREIIAGGIAMLMQKLGIGFTNYTNAKYGESGRIFQGSYKARVISSEEYLQYVDAYIQVLNPFELFEGGIAGAVKNFDKAFQFALDYPFCSLGESFGIRNFSILDREDLNQKFPNIKVYKEFAQDALFCRRQNEDFSLGLIDNDL